MSKYTVEQLRMKLTKENDYLLKCPICCKKMWFSGASSHREVKHDQTSETEFEHLIIEGIKSGTIKPKHFDAPDKSLVTATTRLMHEKKYSKTGIRSLVSGGKVK